MEIHFCDLCNESVPQADLDEGTAVLRNGRVVCRQCEEAMSGELAAASSAAAAETPPASPPPASPPPEPPGTELPAAPPGAGSASGPPPATPGTAGAAVAVVFASIALLATFGAAFYLYEHFDQRHAAEQTQIALSISKAEREDDATKVLLYQRIEEARTEQRQALAELSKQVARLAEASRAQADAVQSVRGDLGRFANELAGLEEVRIEISGQGKQLNQMAGRSSDLANQVLRIADRLQVLENRPVQVAIPTPAAEEEPSRPAWWSHVGELKSQNSGTRWQAVTALGETGDPGVAEYLAPMLKDPDIFVRMATARVLGDLAAPLGIPPLIDALEDPEASVREAAVVALRSITKREHRFDPNAKESDRSKAVRRWRDWWDKAQDEFLGPAGT